jgi:hypothetical protein
LEKDAGRYIVSAATPFTPEDLHDPRMNPAAVMKWRAHRYEDVYACRRWSMFPSIDRVYMINRHGANFISRQVGDAFLPLDSRGVV